MSVDSREVVQQQQQEQAILHALSDKLPQEVRDSGFEPSSLLVISRSDKPVSHIVVYESKRPMVPHGLKPLYKGASLSSDAFGIATLPSGKPDIILMRRYYPKDSVSLAFDNANAEGGRRIRTDERSVTTTLPKRDSQTGETIEFKLIPLSQAIYQGTRGRRSPFRRALPGSLRIEDVREIPQITTRQWEAALNREDFDWKKDQRRKKAAERQEEAQKGLLELREQARRARRWP